MDGGLMQQHAQPQLPQQQYIQQQFQQQSMQQLQNTQMNTNNVLRMPHPGQPQQFHTAPYSMPPQQLLHLQQQQLQQAQLQQIQQQQLLQQQMQQYGLPPGAVMMNPNAAPVQFMHRFNQPPPTVAPSPAMIPATQQFQQQPQSLPRMGLIRTSSTEVAGHPVPMFGQNGAAGVRPSPAPSPATQQDYTGMMYSGHTSMGDPSMNYTRQPVSVLGQYSSAPSNIVYSNQQAMHPQYTAVQGMQVAGYPPPMQQSTQPFIQPPQQQQQQYAPPPPPQTTQRYNSPSTLWHPPVEGYYQQQQVAGTEGTISDGSRGGTMKKKERKHALAIINPESKEEIKLDSPASLNDDAAMADDEQRRIANDFASQVARLAKPSTDNTSSQRASSEQRVIPGDETGVRGARSGSVSSDLYSAVTDGATGQVIGSDLYSTVADGAMVQVSGCNVYSTVTDDATGQVTGGNVYSTVTDGTDGATGLVEELPRDDDSSIGRGLDESGEVLASEVEGSSVEQTSSVLEATAYVDSPTLVLQGTDVDVASDPSHNVTLDTTSVSRGDYSTHIASSADELLVSSSTEPVESNSDTSLLNGTAASSAAVAVESAIATTDDEVSGTALEGEKKTDDIKKVEDVVDNGASIVTSGQNSSTDTPADTISELPASAQGGGLRKYDRNFLLQMKSKKECCVKPRDLPDMPDVVLNSPNPADRLRPSPSHTMPQSASFPSFPDFFTPNFVNPHIGMMRPPMMQRGPPPPGMGGMGYGMRSVGSKPDLNPHRLVISINKDVELKRSENAWKPAALVRKEEDVDPEVAKTQNIYKSVRSILNKITPQKLEILIQKVMNLEINTEERLRGIINILFEKAISEPSFCPAYAQLANRMIAMKAPCDGSPGEMTTFRKLLLNRCQEEFEKDKLDDANIERIKEEIKKETSEEKKKALGEELEETLYKSRKRSLGNIRFIAELFKLKMLTETIMHDCIRKLLKNRDEDCLECLSGLLTNIGKDLDLDPTSSGQKKVGLDSYFSELKKLAVDKKNISSRIRFMLQNVIELKQNKWVPRRVDNNPKTIEQIHQEAQNEKLEKEQMIRNFSNHPPSSINRGRPPVGRGGPGDDGWTSVTPKGRDKMEKIDTDKFMRISKTTPLDENSITLGPPRMGAGMWGSGSRGGGSSRSQEADNNTPTNRFAALDGRESSSVGRQIPLSMSRGGKSFPPRLQEDQRSSSVGYGRNSPRLMTPTGSSREGSRDSSSTRDAPPRPAGAFGRSTPPQVESLSAVVRSLPGSGDPSRDSSLSRGATPSPPVPSNISTASGECEYEPLPRAAESKLQYLLQEYHSEKDVEEACLSMIELNLSSAMFSSAVSFALNFSMEKKLAERKLTGQLIVSWVEKSFLNIEQFLRGLQDILSSMADLIVDIPLAWDYLGSMVEPLVTSEVITLRHLLTACDNVELSSSAATFISHVLKACQSSRDKEFVLTLWQRSGVRWADLVSSDVTKFLESKGLDFLPVE